MSVDPLGRYAGPPAQQERPLWETNPITRLDPVTESPSSAERSPNPASKGTPFTPPKHDSENRFIPMPWEPPELDQESRYIWVQDNVWDKGLIADYGNGNIIDPDTGEIMGTLPDFSR